MPRPPLTLPTEVCEQVLDHLESEIFMRGTNTLYHCCLVCRAWIPRSRFHLYISVDVDPDNLAEFVRGISLQPFNGHLVRELWLGGGRDHRDDHKLSLVPLQLPQLLPNLRHIEFYNRGRTDPSLHPRFFTSLLRFRTVRSLHLGLMKYSTITQLARYVTALPGLDECRVFLYEGDVRSLSFPGPRLPTKRVAISNLTLHLPLDLFQVADPILDIFSPSSIHSLRIELRTPQSDGEEVRRLIASFVTRCADSLCMLDLKYRGWEHLDFSHNTRLVSLSLDMIMYTDFFKPNPVHLVHPSILSRILSTICSKRMKELHLWINISTSSEDTISRSGWDELDATLALPAFSQVERISITVMAYFGPHHDSKSCFISVSERTVQQLLPRLAARSVADLSRTKYKLNYSYDYKISSPDDLGTLNLQAESSELPSSGNEDF